MIKKLMLGLGLITSVFLTGCTDMSITEEELNQEIATRLEQEQPDVIQLTLNDSTLNLDLLVKSADVDLTERDGGLVLVDMKTDIRGTLTAFGREMTMKTELDPSFESGLRIEEDRVYLVGPKLTSITVQGSNFGDQVLRSYLGSLHDEFEAAIARYFNEHPVYVLNHSTVEKAAAKFVKDIVITEDSIEFMIF
ncbi:DUF1439 domain-containing protein [Rhodanobacter aciditrophus]|uniref:DUF1439 domain-containing protein n=1 Tax=Rhodanobacter aciditrophus TaxID=1623218 RepID=A0ABW4AW34_9GAMM